METSTLTAAPPGRRSFAATAYNRWTFPRTDLVLLALWASLIAGAHLWAGHVLASGTQIRLGAAPLFGQLRSGISPSLVVAAGMGAAVVVWGDRTARRLSWPALCTVVFAATAAYAVSLAASEGWAALSAPLAGPHEYLALVPQIDAPGTFLAGFTDRLGSYPIHVQGHPPGMTLLLWLMARAGAGGASWAAGLVIATGSAGVVAALVALRETAGEGSARRAAPFLVVAPAAVWIATSADAFFAGVAAIGIALFVVACSRRGTPLSGRSSRRSWPSDVLAAASGVTLGLALFLSYGVAPLGVVVLAVAAMKRRLRPLLLASAGVALVTVAFWSEGFWWGEGLESTVSLYRGGLAADRPYGLFVATNLAALSIAAGPASFVALRRITWSSEWLLPGSVLLAVGLATLSGLSKGEVERIWLPFVAWIVAATFALPGSGRRMLLALQVITGLIVQALVATPW